MADKKALLIIDMLNDFVGKGAPIEVPGAESIIGPIKQEIEKARVSGYPIIYLCDCHQENDPEFDLFPPHAIRGTEGSMIISELKPQGTDILVRKNTFSGFYNTGLEQMMTKLGVGEVIITGLVTNICVFFTAVDAVIRGFKVGVIKNAVIALDQNDHLYALGQMEKVLKANII
ncbi:MAG: cysteine hydrolase [Actinobacteria bacterium]|nr:cysteine hydrolase [Actinomycetota bacterium]